ncbi:hypothetical protein D9M68_869770 [compost metagenome]
MVRPQFAGVAPDFRLHLRFGVLAAYIAPQYLAQIQFVFEEVARHAARWRQRCKQAVPDFAGQQPLLAGHALARGQGVVLLLQRNALLPQAGQALHQRIVFRRRRCCCLGHQFIDGTRLQEGLHQLLHLDVAGIGLVRILGQRRAHAG